MPASVDPEDSHAEVPAVPEPGPLALPLVALVGLGGVPGTALRWALSTTWLPGDGGFPRGTLIANLVGALVLGVLLEALARQGPDLGRRRQVRLLIGTGFCGGLTTYSTLAVETDLLIRAHRDALGVTYALLSVLAGIAVAGVGIAIGARLDRRTA